MKNYKKTIKKLKKDVAFRNKLQRELRAKFDTPACPCPRCSLKRGFYMLLSAKAFMKFDPDQHEKKIWREKYKDLKTINRRQRYELSNKKENPIQGIGDVIEGIIKKIGEDLGIDVEIMQGQDKPAKKKPKTKKKGNVVKVEFGDGN